MEGGGHGASGVPRCPERPREFLLAPETALTRARSRMSPDVDQACLCLSSSRVVLAASLAAVNFVSAQTPAPAPVPAP